MSFKEYLHEKAEESRQNEMLAYVMFLAGAIFFIGGILITLSLTKNPNWFVFIPYQQELNAGAVLSLVLAVSGLCLLFSGVAVGLNCSHERKWYMEELRKANSEVFPHSKTAKNTRKKKREIT